MYSLPILSTQKQNPPRQLVDTAPLFSLYFARELYPLCAFLPRRSLEIALRFIFMAFLCLITPCARSAFSCVMATNIKSAEFFTHSTRWKRATFIESGFYDARCWEGSPCVERSLNWRFFRWFIHGNARLKFIDFNTSLSKVLLINWEGEWGQFMCRAVHVLFV